MPPYAVLDKPAGETPLQTLEAYRATQPNLQDVPMAYAGRLDPMASGQLLVLLGEECKRQAQYHALDKAYRVEILFGVSSDTGDVLGRLTSDPPPTLSRAAVQKAIASLPRTITLPYPRFSAKTVAGKPLHVWTLEGRLDEITIPTHTSQLYRTKLTSFTERSGQDIYTDARARIDALAPVTDQRKQLGADFRRTDVRADWDTWLATYATTTFPVATIDCVVSSGTYMRTLAEHIAAALDTTGLALRIHRRTIGRYRPLPLGFGLWTKRYH